MEFFNEWSNVPCEEIDQSAEKIFQWGQSISYISGICLSLDEQWPMIEIEVEEKHSLHCVQELGLMLQELLDLPIYWVSVTPCNVVFLVGATLEKGVGFDEALEYQMQPWEHIASPIHGLQIKN